MKNIRLMDDGSHSHCRRNTGKAWDHATVSTTCLDERLAEPRQSDCNVGGDERVSACNAAIECQDVARFSRTDGCTRKRRTYDDVSTRAIQDCPQRTSGRSIIRVKV